jgi:hypothetical protein
VSDPHLEGATVTKVEEAVVVEARIDCDSDSE